jgi:UDP-galactopyranose mutase
LFLLVFPENVLIIIISICNRENTMKYDYLVVGSGLYGAIFAHEAKAKGKSVLVVDKRPNIAGNVYTEKQEGINVHMYGAHIFHTNDKRVWNYITQFAEFNRFTNSPVANYKGELYSMPFNMYTFNKMWGVVTPEEAAAKIEEQKKEITGEPKNLEEQAISLVGRDIYEKLVKGYTEKQWGRDCKELPAFIIKRLPVRLTFDNNYFNALYQGIPIGGYTKMVENLLDGIEVRLNTDYLEHKAELDALADKVVYTGPIDAYFSFKLGTLEYRSVRFENETLDIPNFQGNAAVNYTDRETPGWKFASQEVQGISTRIEIGPKDIEKNQCVIVRRDTREKIVVSLDEVNEKLAEVLETMQNDMLEKAKAFLASHINDAHDYNEFKAIAETKPGFIRAMWCGDEACENKIKEDTTVTSRCMPFGDQEQISDVCVCCGKPAHKLVYWGKAY